MKVIVALDVLFLFQKKKFLIAQKKIPARLSPPVETKREFSGDVETGGG